MKSLIEIFVVTFLIYICCDTFLIRVCVCVRVIFKKEKLIELILRNNLEPDAMSLAF